MESSVFLPDIFMNSICFHSINSCPTSVLIHGYRVMLDN